MTDGAGEPNQRVLPEREFEARLGRIQQAMAARGIAVIVLTAQDNFIYLTGFDSPTWVNLARPRYCVVPARGDPILIVPTTNVSAAERLTWVRHIRSWVSPNAADDGISLVLDAVRAVAAPGAAVGMEIGHQSRLGMPAADFLVLREALLPRPVVDADALLRETRKVKSSFEIEAIRRAAAATSRAFAALLAGWGQARDEADVVREFRALLFAAGVDDAPYLVAESGLGGYPSLQMAASSRRLETGTILGIDAGCRVLGYFCDFNRNFGFGRVPERALHIHDALWLATQAGIDAARPGASAGDVWRAQARTLDETLGRIGGRRTQSGRMGHGIGLRLTEPPSIHPDDTTVLVPGMVLTIEPSAEFELSVGGRDLRRLLIHEENLVVTEDGAQLLSVRAPRALPIID